MNLPMHTDLYIIPYKEYIGVFQDGMNPYISSFFIGHNRSKVEELICLVNKKENPDIGLVAGVKNQKLLSPFSAPFGGFHYRHEAVYSAEVDIFLGGIKTYFSASSYTNILITLPPDIYSSSMNAKFVNSFIRTGFNLTAAEVTNYIPLELFAGSYKHRTAREYYKQAQKNGLTFSETDDLNELKFIYEIIEQNRSRMNRPIFMTLEDLIAMKSIWPVDFFIVKSNNGEPVAGGVFYRAHHSITQAVLWGDSELGRSLRAMDFMILHLIEFYKKEGFRYIDLGISTENNKPNNGLLRFKETHESHTGMRFSFSLNK